MPLTLSALVQALRDTQEGWRRAKPARCIACRKETVRYVYNLDWRGRVVRDDTLCQTCGPVDGDVPPIDYGFDVRVTVGDVDDDVAEVVAARQEGRQPRINRCPPTCRSIVPKHTHTRPKDK